MASQKKKLKSGVAADSALLLIFLQIAKDHGTGFEFTADFVHNIAQHQISPKALAKKMPAMFRRLAGAKILQKQNRFELSARENHCSSPLPVWRVIGGNTHE